MQEIEISADELVAALLNLSEKETVCLLDSCGVSHLGSHFLLAGIKPLEIHEISDNNHENTLEFLDKKLSNGETFAFFTLSYEFGLKLNRIKPRKKEFSHFDEPDLFLALFDCLIIHDYDTKKTHIIGNKIRFDEITNLLFSTKNEQKYQNFSEKHQSKAKSNFTKSEYLEKIAEIKEFIRRGDTYQTNLTQQITAELPDNLTPQQIFYNLRQNHPAPFASFLKRKDSFVISASPERFFAVKKGRNTTDRKCDSTISENTLINSRVSAFSAFEITTSPIKGTRPRGKSAEEDEELRNELLNSAKDRAENVMIVDLLRNDLGRICEFGSVTVEKLCDLEEHPTLFHLTSTINGILREKTQISDIIRAVFPCGSITGAPKIRTMQIIDQLETANRGLSMGAIGFSIFHLTDSSVAIRTMTIKDNKATFNVGGGIVIDSIAENEYEETLIKAKALLDSINGDVKNLQKTA
ncbi:aminodeoxychorismate synthase component I [soil metagenome]